MPIIKITRQGLSAIALYGRPPLGVPHRRARSGAAGLLGAGQGAARDLTDSAQAANTTGFGAGAVPPSSRAHGGGISSTIATMAKLVAVLPIVLFAAGCSRTPSAQLARLSDEFVHTTLAFSPAMATGVGLHQYEGQNLDNLLDDT